MHLIYVIWVSEAGILKTAIKTEINQLGMSEWDSRLTCNCEMKQVMKRFPELQIRLLSSTAASSWAIAMSFITCSKPFDLHIVTCHTFQHSCECVFFIYYIYVYVLFYYFITYYRG